MNDLYKSQTNRVILGVCGGLGEYFDIDPTIIRLLFIIFTFAGGAAILIYLALAVIMPVREGEAEPKLIEDGMKNAKEFVHSVFSNEEVTTESIQKRRNTLAIAVFLIGLFALLNNENLFVNVNFSLLWPTFIMVVGLALFAKKKLSQGVLLFLVVAFLLLALIFSNGFLHLM